MFADDGFFSKADSIDQALKKMFDKYQEMDIQ
jgi:hypothetical protein